MFDKVKQAKKLLELRSEAKKLQEQLAQIEHSEEGRNMRVKVNGSQEVLYIEIDGESQEQLVELLNKALKEVQKESAKKMMEMGGGLSGLLGGMGQ
jgi:DNA-binding protein YbaB